MWPDQVKLTILLPIENQLTLIMLIFFVQKMVSAYNITSAAYIQKRLRLLLSINPDRTDPKGHQSA